MKIAKFKTTLVNVPLEKPIATAIHQMDSVGYVLLELETDQALVAATTVRVARNTAGLKRRFSVPVIGRCNYPSVSESQAPATVHG